MYGFNVLQMRSSVSGLIRRQTRASERAEGRSQKWMMALRSSVGREMSDGRAMGGVGEGGSSELGAGSTAVVEDDADVDAARYAEICWWISCREGGAGWGGGDGGMVGIKATMSASSYGSWNE